MSLRPSGLPGRTASSRSRPSATVPICGYPPRCASTHLYATPHRPCQNDAGAAHLEAPATPTPAHLEAPATPTPAHLEAPELGRASCRERGRRAVGAAE